jgi:hypothetical protein
MPSYAVDSSKQPMIGTGVVEARPEWEEKPGGGRRPSDRQARDERTGMPLWGVEVMYQQTAYGRVSSVVGSVTVGALDQPQVSALGPIAFEGLTVEVRALKTGGLVENWAAEKVADPVGPGRPAAASARGGSSGGEGS